jgi:hypothetical protein
MCKEFRRRRSLALWLATIRLAGWKQRLTRPLLCITGTLDADVAGTGSTAEQRRAVYGALPTGDNAQLVLQAEQHALVSSITTGWWRATLMGDAVARSRLAAPQGLRNGDLWQRK